MTETNATSPELLETISAASHDGWMKGKAAQGIASRKSEWSEELMVPYDQLSEKAKDLDRAGIASVLAAIDQAGFQIVAK
jgi:hypothetical protein